MNSINALIYENSPYLLQHAKNPVNWFAWNESALEKAKQEKKLILLSIGYSACHWCHVMAHESFEDEETASLMNRFFINIKVDREERPDLDKIYQTAHSFLTHQPGGWPLTVFLMPDDLSPIFSGTYFPKETRYSLPSFKQVLRAVYDLYITRPHELKQNAAKLAYFLAVQQTLQPQEVSFNEQPIRIAISVLKESFDEKYGGLGLAPKFPQPAKLGFLLSEFPSISLFTLRKMAEGGIYDHLGGGFFRYTVDEAWRVPHFEKMLYDNAQLLYLYTLAAKQFNEPLFERIALETADWIMREMQMEKGGYYSSIDADVEGNEGAFYTWQPEEVKRNLNQKEFEVIQLHYGLNQPASFHQNWHFYMVQSPKSISEKLQLSQAEIENEIHSARCKLLVQRNRRSRPQCDRKILTAWNALTIKAMIVTASVLNKKCYLQSAQTALSFIKEHLFIKDRLSVSWYQTVSPVLGFLDDYAFLLDAVLTSLQYQWETSNLNLAIKLADYLVDYFYDSTSGGFFFTPHDQMKVVYRPKTLTDEATPAGNGVAMTALFTLGHLLGESRYLLAAEKSLVFAWPMLTSHPDAYCGLLQSLKEFLAPSLRIILRGEMEEMEEWSRHCRSICQRVTLFPIPSILLNLPLALKMYAPRSRICAYLCKGTQCLHVADSLEDLRSGLTLATQ